MIVEEFQIKKDEINNEIDMNYWNDPCIINDYWDDHKKSVNIPSGIVEVKYGNIIYKTWKVEFIRQFIYKFLKEKYPDSIIAREICKIDVTLFDNLSNKKIPIEIERTPLHIHNKNRNKTFNHSQFEKEIRKGIEDNIENYGTCWFFMDFEYLRYLQSDFNKGCISINMTWFIEYMKENKLKAFSIKYDGFVKELSPKDFDFLKNISQTCKIGYYNDDRVLNRNKLEIYHNVIKGYKFTQEEITQFENEFDNRINKEIKGSQDYFKISDNKKCKLYGNIMEAFDSLNDINNTLSCKMNKYGKTVYGYTLGIFYQNEFHGNNKQSRIHFVDKFDIAQYFPGYLRNKRLWDYCKNKKRVFAIDEFKCIIEGTFNYEFIKKQSTMEDY